MSTPESNPGSNPERPRPRLGSGILLAARETLQDPNFQNAIVLLCQCGEEGAYGLVLNRPSHMPLREIFEHPPAASAETATRRIYIGGPVQPTELQILQIGEPQAPETMQIAPGVHLGGQWETLDEILAPDPQALRIFLGYAGWGEGQLEEEIDAGAWEVLEADIARLLAAPDTEWFAGAPQLRRFLESL